MLADQYEECQSAIENIESLSPKQYKALSLKCHGVDLEEQRAQLNLSDDGLRQLWRRTRDKLGIPSAYDDDFKKQMQKYCNCLEEYEQTRKSGDDQNKVQVIDAEDATPIANQTTPLQAQATSLAIRHNDLQELIQIGDDPSKAEYFELLRLAQQAKRTQRLPMIVFLGSIMLFLMLGGIIGYLLRSAQTPAIPFISIPVSQNIPTLTPVKVTDLPTQGIISTTTGCKNIVAFNAPPPLKSQGVTQFTPDNTQKGVISSFARALLVDKRGLFAGYFGKNGLPGGVGFTDRKYWQNCELPGSDVQLNINALAIDKNGKVWVATEHNGVGVYDGASWRMYGLADGLPTMDLFGITVDSLGNIFVATFQGVAKFDGVSKWSVIYSVENRTLVNNHVHALAFDKQGNVWFAYLDKGLSVLQKNGEWKHFNTNLVGNAKISGDDIRAISVQTNVVWVASADGGLMAYENNAWRFYRMADGLPSDSITGLAIDHYGRPWVATDKGVAYLSNSKWEIYHSLPALSVAFGPACTIDDKCPYDEEHVLTGLVDGGITHSRLPYKESTFDFLLTRYFRSNGELVAAFPVFKPGEKFRFEIDARPKVGYRFSNLTGDALWSLDSDAERFGGFSQIPVAGITEAGQIFTFTDFDNLIVAPDLPNGTNEKTFMLRYRMWQWGRATGPVFSVQFTVKR